MSWPLPLERMLPPAFVTVVVPSGLLMVPVSRTSELLVFVIVTGVPPLFVRLLVAWKLVVSLALIVRLTC